MVVFPMLGKFSNDTSFYKFVCRLDTVSFSFSLIPQHYYKIFFLST